MHHMISTGLKTYGGKPLKKGQRFEVEDERHVRTLETSHLAKKAPADKNDEKAKELTAGKGGEYETRDMTAGPSRGARVTK